MRAVASFARRSRFWTPVRATPAPAGRASPLARDRAAVRVCDTLTRGAAPAAETMSLSHPQVEHGYDGRSTVPDDREGHTASVIGTKIYVFGGTWTDEEDRTMYLNDLHVLDAPVICWSRPSWSGTPPIEREGHSASVVGSSIFFFAGTWVDVDDDDTSVYLNDLHVLDTTLTSWSQPVTSGVVPSQREGHTASVVGEKIVVFGGAGLDKEDSSVNLSDMHILDTVTLTWSQPHTAGPLPQERRYHSATVIDRKIFVFGGQVTRLARLAARPRRTILPDGISLTTPSDDSARRSSQTTTR